MSESAAATNSTHGFSSQVEKNAANWLILGAFALITFAGLIHAGFEDWLFAAGSYLCVFFWVSAFLLIDLASPANAAVRIPSAQAVRSFAQAPGFRGSTTSV